MEKKWPQLSICIPTYNRKVYLKQCIESIVNQKWFNKEDVEIVISDNASNDNTTDLIREYQNKYQNIRYFRNKKNIWGMKNILNITELAKWEYIWLMWDDDQIKNWWLDIIINTIKKHNDIVLLHTNMIDWLYNNINNIIIKDWITYFKDLLQHNKASKILIFLTYISTLVFKKENFIQYLNEFRENFPHKLEESYSHFYIGIRCINKQNIALLGDIIIWGTGDRTDISYWRNNSKKWYDVVITNGINKIYEDHIFLDSIGITKKEVDKYKYNFIKIYYMVKLSCFMKRIWIYKPMVYLFKKFLFKYI